ncbi:MAG TPA: DUF1292 domain-containing protein [Firmicutes bacterium]|nr:DUF1292 domain-containing protein [Bacillota bacterium]HHY97972.1 DUF1292 domain-containing protein [Bacillota bacterium]
MPDQNLTDEDVITLVYDDGQEETFTVLDTIELDGKTYAVLLPDVSDSQVANDDEDYLEERIFRVEHENGEEILVDVDDDEYERVVDALDEAWAEEMEAMDEDDDADSTEDEEDEEEDEEDDEG